MEAYAGRDPETIGRADAQRLADHFNEWFRGLASPRKVFVPCVLTPWAAPRFDIGPVTFVYIDEITTSEFYPTGPTPDVLAKQNFDMLLELMRETHASWLARVAVEGCEQQRALSKPDIQRLFAHAVAYKMQNTIFAIPDAGGKHPGKLLKRCLYAVAFERGQHNLGVAVAVETMALGFESRPQAGKIVNLAVEGHDEIFISRQHRLVAGVGQINNREATMAKSDAAVAVEPSATAIRPAMIERRSHRTDRRKMARVRCAGEENACDTTHLVSSTVAPATPCGFPQRPGRSRWQTRRPGGGRSNGRR